MNHYNPMEKAKENYICEGYKRLAQIDANILWSKTPQVEIPKFKMPPVEKNKVGWLNFVLLLENLKP